MVPVLGVVAALTLAQGEPSLLFPERRGGFVSVEAQARLVLTVPRWSVGVLGETSATWYAPFPLAVRLRAWPLSLFSQGRFPGAPAGNAAVSLEVLLDTSWFAIGVGGGGGSFYVQDVDASDVHEFAFRVNAFARLGALDGLHLRGRFHLRSLGATLWPAGLEASVQVPVAQDWWLSLNATGDVDFAAGDLSLRFAVKRELFFTFLIGFAEHFDAFGPSVGAALEYRTP